MCTAGTWGECMWATSEMPEAQKRGSSSAPGMEAANSGAKLPCTVEMLTPTFSNTRPFMIDMVPPPPGAPSWLVRCQLLRSNRPGASAPFGASGVSASSRPSKAVQISSRSC